MEASTQTAPVDEVPVLAARSGGTSARDVAVSSVWDEREGLAILSMTVGQPLVGWSHWGGMPVQAAPGAVQQAWAPGWPQPQASYAPVVQGGEAGVPWSSLTGVVRPSPLGHFMGPTQQAQGQAGLVTDQSERPRISYGDIALPLGGHLALSVKERMREGELIDIFRLLQVKPEEAQMIGGPRRDLETTRKRQIDQNWLNWLNSYVIYPFQVLSINIKYIIII